MNLLQLIWLLLEVIIIFLQYVTTSLGADAVLGYKRFGFAFLMCHPQVGGLSNIWIIKSSMLRIIPIQMECK